MNFPAIGASLSQIDKEGPMTNRTPRWRFGLTLMVLVGAAGATSWMQTATADPGSIAGLTAEVRQLRVAVEQSTRTQSQTQALSVYLSAQQSRMVQLAQRLDRVRDDATAARARSQQIAGLLKMAAGDPDPSASAAERAEHNEMTRLFKAQVDQAAEEEQRLRAREAEMQQMMQQEEARWTDLISRLETLIKR